MNARDFTGSLRTLLSAGIVSTFKLTPTHPHENHPEMSCINSF